MSTESTLELAAAVQRALLPKTCPTCRCSRMAARWIPHESVGGDFYALPEVAEKYRGIVIGDAVGHGAPAAILMALIAGTIRGLAAVEHHPRDLTVQVSRVLAELTHDAPGRPEVFLASMFYAQVDAQTRIMRYANAGHPPPLLIRKRDSSVEWLSATGTLMGIDPKLTYDEVELSVDSGDRLVLVTDGILEARNAIGDQFGTAGTQEAAAACAGDSPDACAEAIVAAAEAFRDGEPSDDDQTVLVVDFV